MKTVRRFFPLLTLSLLLAWGVKASAPPLEHAQAIPLALVQRGISEIHDFSLPDFTRKMNGIGLIPATTVRSETRLRSEVRTGSGYLLGQNLILIPEAYSRFPSDLYAQFLVHESLGALGYNDDHYQLSGPLTALSVYGPYVGSVDRQRSLLSTPLFEAFKEARPATSRELKLARRGGGTHAGGGGELFPFLIRTTLDFRLMMLASDPSFNFDWIRYQTLEIENVEISELQEKGEVESIQKIDEDCPAELAYVLVPPAKFVFNRPTPERIRETGARSAVCAAQVILQVLRTPRETPSP